MEEIQEDRTVKIGRERFRPIEEQEFAELVPGREVLVIRESDSVGHPVAFKGKVDSYPYDSGYVVVEVMRVVDYIGPEDPDLDAYEDVPTRELYLLIEE